MAEFGGHGLAARVQSCRFDRINGLSVSWNSWPFSAELSVPAGPARLQDGLSALVAPSFNGRTPASGAGYRGSNPWGAANQINNVAVRPAEQCHDWAVDLHLQCSALRGFTSSAIFEFGMQFCRACL